MGYKVGVALRRSLAVGCSFILMLVVAPASAAVPLEYDLAVSGAGPGGCVPYLVGYGRACITQYDVIWIEDGQADGSSVGVHWRFLNGDRRGICRWTGGSGTEGHCDKNFHNHRIEWRVGRCDGDVADCSVPAGYRDWTPWNRTQPGEV